MKYITGIHALNLECSLDTCGDWHTSALAWKNITYRDTDKSIFGNFGIEGPKKLPNGDIAYCANHIRAILDILETGSSQDIRELKNFYNDFICTDKYDELIMSKVMVLKNSKNWEDISKLMGFEFKCKWIDFLRGH